MQVITTHFNADFDCVAAMVAAQKLYPQAKMVFSGSMEKSVRDFIKRFPATDRFSRIKDVDFDQVDLLVVVDTQDPERIGVFKALLGRPEVQVHVYDHHTDVTEKIFPHQSTVLKRGSSATILFEALDAKGISLTPDESTLLVLGIYEDTHSMSSSASTPQDFYAVAKLLEMGADLNTVADFVEPRLNREQVDVMNGLIRNLELCNFNGVEVGVATATVEHYVGDLAFAVHKIRDLENLRALFALIQMDQRVYLIARSHADDVNVAQILRAFGGNGHPGAASASIREMTIIQVREKLVQVLGEKIQPLRLVGDIMHSPAIFAGEKDSMLTVEKILTRFNLNTLPVIADGKPVGLITRQIVEKAIYHKMGNEPTEEVMIREFAVTIPEAFFKTVIPIVIEHKQKLIPVVGGDGRIVGIVSRGDLLRVFHGELAEGGEAGGAFLFDGQIASQKNVKSRMKEQLPKNLMTLLEALAITANEIGMSIYVVGGFVRDLLLMIENFDVDVVVEGDGIRFAGILGEKLQGRVRSHAKFGTSVVVLQDGFKIDVATARMEYYKYPGALPTVEASSIKSDLFRRDFSVNSLAVKLNGKDSFSLIDFFNGQRDLKNKVIRVLHNLSFIEDPSRAFRAVRFEQRFQFAISSQTLAFMKSAIKRKLINELSGHRLLTELILILKERKPLHCIRRMKELELLQFIHPRLLQTPAEFNILERIRDFLAGSKIIPLDKPPEVWFLYFLGMFYALDGPAREEAIKRLQLPARMRERLMRDIEGSKNALRVFGREPDPDPVGIYEIFSGLSPEAVMLLLAVSDSERISKHVVLFFTHYHANAALFLTGDDLTQMGLKPGPVFQAVFKALRDARLHGQVKTREDEIAFVKRHFQVPESKPYTAG